MTGTQARHSLALFPSSLLDTPVSQGKGQAGVGGRRDCSNLLHAVLPSSTLRM